MSVCVCVCMCMLVLGTAFFFIKMTERSALTQKDGRVTANGQNGRKVQDEDNRKVGLGKKVTLLRGISIIIGTIIGAGIFISPKGILKHSGSIGMSLVVWIACGVLSLFGELIHSIIFIFHFNLNLVFVMHNHKRKSRVRG